MEFLKNLIGSLLLEHEMVVVPTLGAFIAHYRASEQDTDGADSDTTFFPPAREVAFNQDVQEGDGLLVHAYMTLLDLDYPSAERMLYRGVAELQQSLSLNGMLEIPSVGLLMKDILGRVTLVADESGVCAPALFALPSVSMERIEQVAQARNIAEELRKTSVVSVVSADKDEEQGAAPIVIRMPRRWVDVAVSAAAAVLLFFLVSNPFSSRDDAGEAQVASVVAQHAATRVAEEQVPEGKFSIVLASKVTKENADWFVAQLTKEGYSDGRYSDTGSMPRVLYGRYQTEEEATAALNSLKGESKSFKHGWVIETE